MTTLAAIDAADAIGLPPVWRSTLGIYLSPIGSGDQYPPGDMDLMNKQTAYGLALLLDAWQRAGDVGKDLWMHWVTSPSDGTLCLSAVIAMAARITHIAHDRRIRRALGEDPKPGTLATVSMVNGCWRLDAREYGGPFIEWAASTGEILGGANVGPDWWGSIPALADATNPDDARRVMSETITQAKT